MAENQKYPIGRQDFRTLRNDGFMYVDKTELIYRLIEEGKYYFFSRPRRFGKSLLLSTIKEVFSGDKKLFDGLWIVQKMDSIGVHPVIHLSFANIGFQQIGLEEALSIALDEQAKFHGLALTHTAISLKFKELIQNMAAKGQVVVLVDEYDKPIIEYLSDNLEQAKTNRNILKGFFSILKDADSHLRLVFITGVSKFSKVSIFSDLNNLDVISLDARYTALCGYTQSEMEHYFAERTGQLAEKMATSKEQATALIKEWYNGYNWGGNANIYNPFSILSLMSKLSFENYWFETGTPTFLVKTLNRDFLFDIEVIEADKAIFNTFDLENLDTVSLLFQTGYLTVKEFTEYQTVLLGYPNKEVKDSLIKYLLGDYMSVSPAATTPLVVQILKAFKANNVEQVVSIIHTLFKSIPNQIFLAHTESFYHAIIHLSLTLLGQYIDSEVSTSDGRMDAVVHTADRTYILEFKLDKSPEEALQQIFDKDYPARFRHADKPVTAIGINFSSVEKGVAGWLAKEV